MKWDRDSTDDENENCLSPMKVFDGAQSFVKFMFHKIPANWKRK